MGKLNLLTSEQFTDTALLDELLAKAAEMEEKKKNGSLPKTLAGKVIACLFFESSTRSRLSFETAALQLDAKVIDMQDGMKTSSTIKGESLEDTIKIVNGYADCIVIRHPEEGSAERAAKVSNIPIINAGDGGNQHPTQTLLDLYTIKKEIGRFDNLRIAFGFDPQHSRTIKSLALVLSHYKNVEFTFIAPEPAKASPEFLDKLRVNGAKIIESSELTDGLETDIFYTNRLQEERFENHEVFEQYRKAFILEASMLKDKKVLIMNPLPRVDEMESAVDDTPNAIYFKQAHNGVFVRMALFEKIFKG